MDPAILITTESMTTIARLLLAGVFIVAGVAKLMDRGGSRQALEDFGVPSPASRPLAVLLPLGELAVAAALVFSASVFWGGVGALALLLAFIAGISANLARGRTPNCHCFGQLSSSPAGTPTLVRNVALAMVASFVVWQAGAHPGPTLIEPLVALTSLPAIGLVTGAILLTLIAIEGWLLFNLLKQNGRLLLRIESLEKRIGNVPPPNGVTGPAAGLPVASPAPTFSLVGLHGETLTLESLRAAEKPTVLVFSDPGCGPCNGLLPDIGRWQRDFADKLTIALITRGTSESNRAKSAEHNVTNVLLQQDREIAEAYKIVGTPSVVVVRPDGTIASPAYAGADAIRSLVNHLTTASSPLQMAATGGCPSCGKDHGAAPSPSSTRIGEAAPALRLTDLAGDTVDLADFRGSTTLVLFWNPGCGYCQKMLSDLKAWEADPPTDAPRVIVVSDGPVEANVAQGLRSRVVLDRGFNIGRAFGATGTPSAVLVDPQGRIASAVAVGASAVFALAATEVDAPARS